MILVVYAFLPYVVEEVWYRFLQVRNVKYVINTRVNAVPGQNIPSVFGAILAGTNLTVDPVNRDFSIVIEKIGLNAPIVMGVSVTDPVKYTEALKQGVAQALVSDLPSTTPGNVYLFAHTSFNFWDLGKYATAFNLLRKLELGDEVNIFYHGKRFVYKVVNKETLPGWNTYPLTRAVVEPLVTMQTCDPPGTTLNRLVVTAKLQKVL